MTFDKAMTYLLRGDAITRKSQFQYNTWYELHSEKLWLMGEFYRIEEVFNGDDVAADGWIVMSRLED